MRLQPKSPPDPRDRRLRQPGLRAIDRVDQCVASLGEDSNVRTITSSTCSSVSVRATPAEAHRPARPADARQTGCAIWSPTRDDPETISDLGVLQALGRNQHDPRALRQSLRARSTPRPRLQLTALLIRQHNLNSNFDGITHSCPLPGFNASRH